MHKKEQVKNLLADQSVRVEGAGVGGGGCPAR